MLTIINAQDFDQPSENEFERRVADINIHLGDLTWMNPDTQAPEWEVVESYVYKLDGSAAVEVISVVAVRKVGEVGKRTWIDEEFPDSTVTLYLLDGKVYEHTPYSVASWDKPPTLGAFQEFEPECTKLKPVDKEITHFDKYLPTTGAPYPAIYMAHLAPIKTPMLA